MDTKYVNQKAEEIRNQVIDLWGKTVGQLEQISRNLMESGVNIFKVEQAKLLAERDRLLNRLGEETYRLLDAGKVKLPKSVTETYIKVRKVMDRIMIPKEGRAPARRTRKRSRKSTA